MLFRAVFPWNAYFVKFQDWKNQERVKERVKNERECEGCYHNQLQWREKPVIIISEFAVCHYLKLRPDSMSVVTERDLSLGDEINKGEESSKQMDGVKRQFEVGISFFTICKFPKGISLA